MTFKQQINTFLKAVHKDIDESQEKKGIRASGESSRSLREEVDGNEGRLTGRAYFEYQDKGRGPTIGGGNGSLQKRIREWLDYKRFSKGLPPKQKEGLSWAISKAIHKKGTKRGRSAQYPGLGLEKIIDRRRKQFVIQIRGNTQKLFSEVLKTLK